VACPIRSPVQLLDDELVQRVRGGDVALFETVIRRYNQRLFRIARAALRDDDAAEDVLQETWLLAFQRLSQLQSGARLGGWLCSIALHEIRLRLRRQRLYRPLSLPLSSAGLGLRSESPNPEQQTQSLRVTQRLARAVDLLPLGYRMVFMLREVEELSTSETATALGLRDEAVKTRLHRARRLLRKELRRELGGARALFRFGGASCDRLVAQFWLHFWQAGEK
jgi:RNA polymerase sigma-70 factor, ECF subfamily